MLQTDLDNTMLLRLQYLMLALITYVILSYCWERNPFAFTRTFSSEVTNNPSPKDYQPLYFPDTQKIHYRIPRNSPVLKVRIYDMDGHFIYGENSFPMAKTAIKTIDFSKNKPGQYFFVIKQEGKITFRKQIGENTTQEHQLAVEATIRTDK